MQAIDIFLNALSFKLWVGNFFLNVLYIHQYCFYFIFDQLVTYIRFFMLIVKVISYKRYHRVGGSGVAGGATVPPDCGRI